MKISSFKSNYRNSNYLQQTNLDSLLLCPITTLFHSHHDRNLLPFLNSADTVGLV